LKNKIHIFLALILLLSFAVQSSAKSVIFFRFTLNQTELAQTVCENKDKPKSCCEAKCYLEKEIKKEEKRESNPTSDLKSSTEKNEQIASYYFLNIIFTQSHFLLVFKNQKKYLFNFNNSIFHPPNL